MPTDTAPKVINKRIESSKIGSALKKVTAALETLSPEDRLRVVTAVKALFGDLPA